MNDKFTQIDGKFYKECKVVLLPTKEKSNLYEYENKLRYSNEKFINGVTDTQNYFIYILSNEEIKEGDWVYDDEADKKYYQELLSNTKDYTTYSNEYGKKIIATTNSELQFTIECPKYKSYGELQIYSLPRPSDDFLKKYCELGGIDELLVEYENFRTNNPDYPHQSNKEFIDNWILKVASDNTITIKSIKNNYNREEVKILLSKVISEHCMLSLCNQPYNEKEERELIAKWIKENL